MESDLSFVETESHCKIIWAGYHKSAYENYVSVYKIYNYIYKSYMSTYKSYKSTYKYYKSADESS
ncbi:hypothetical protein DU57_01595 [Methanosarcina mazei]|uniref:Uncharacterized protein n=1 Tax=Methanosarcina mazei TaxID=2209 RepID=A0A0F8ISQ1_METMZ|nr:hypothetical protein DU34_06330 [Methanosarcina mazei]KKG27795.1 hypothetical protein DU49_15295 [Methanosarcina mazei]KKG34652.1 hypothetical protein DU52_13690 [Methanosarcina mazei]KKG36557.1 hypothetical protein DU30_14775 [Methanosarcina mazei]KKG42238.1 hypothetical protein DU41_14950 [Methanosarcina mazei]